jgi:hypothetical protein
VNVYILLDAYKQLSDIITSELEITAKSINKKESRELLEKIAIDFLKY